MRTEISSRPQSQDRHTSSILSLITGIIQDAVVLISKEFAAAQLEIHDELDRAKSVALLTGVGAGALVAGTVLLCLMLVYLLQTLTGFDLWRCYALVGGMVIGVGVIILWYAKRQAGGAKLMPARSVEKAKEDARWITHRVK
jgi:hypothetical protein